ncbi:MO25-like protein [Populus alba x Populus x berolinensis]|nr:MO25-like protein [Populus alba x Populus x berolinensis]
MKGLFKSKPRTPVDIVRQTRDLLIYADQSSASLSDSKREEKFFAEFNSKLLESTNYITRRQAVKLLGDILLDRSNAVVMTRYVSLESSHERAWLFIVIILHKL